IKINDTEAMFAFDQKRVNTILSFTNLQVEERGLIPSKLLASLSLDDKGEDSLVAKKQNKSSDSQEEQFS
ncbi:MAG: hypothetical protein MR514_00005, partial [Succinivibrio sp.]|nr:hypothetical protein [Succinivibrio sp.]